MTPNAVIGRNAVTKQPRGARNEALAGSDPGFIGWGPTPVFLRFRPCNRFFLLCVPRRAELSPVEQLARTLGLKAVDHASFGFDPRLAGGIELRVNLEHVPRVAHFFFGRREAD